MNGRRIVSRAAMSLLFLWVIVTAGEAWAVPIGSFAWSEDFFGPVFSVENFSDVVLTSPDSFFDVFVDLETESGFWRVDVQGLGFGREILAGTSAQSIDDLTPLSIVSANLSLTFPLGNVTVVALTASNTSTVIDFSLPESPPGGSTSVPEPSALMLLATGLIGWLAMRGLGKRCGAPS